MIFKDVCCGVQVGLLIRLVRLGFSYPPWGIIWVWAMIQGLGEEGPSKTDQ